ncbi:MAG TPA: copper chaperone PCu(A)C [Xanthomonadales bacterium]|nr:copper chaperone PCu(A)C [Xanthomonadales bacterium]
MNIRAVSVFLAALLAWAPFAHADGLTIEDAWIRAAPPGADVLAGYATLRNGGEASLTITGARSADFARVELHEMRMDGGVMRMRPLSGVAIAPRGNVSLAPGGTHFMLLEPKRALKVGDVVEVELLEASGAAHAARFEVREAQ